MKIDGKHVQCRAVIAPTPWTMGQGPQRCKRWAATIYKGKSLCRQHATEAGAIMLPANATQRAR